MSIQFIIFDLAEVLLKRLLGVEKVLSKRLKIPAAEVASAVRSYALDEPFRGKTTEEQYVIEILQTNSWNLTKEELKKTVFINDSEANIQAAQSLGMHTIRFESAKQLKKELVRRKLI